MYWRKVVWYIIVTAITAQWVIDCKNWSNNVKFVAAQKSYLRHSHVYRKLWQRFIFYHMTCTHVKFKFDRVANFNISGSQIANV